MPKLPHLSGSEIVQALERLGFTRARQRGSHVVMIKTTEEGKIGCVIPLHKEVATGTLHSILRQARVTTEEFLSSVNK